jgi:TRAP-type C4-dicarboxylate transport system permease small subunit
MAGHSIFRGFSAGVRKTALLFGYFGSVAMCLMAVIVTVDVTGRFLFNKPLRGGIEIVEELMVCVIFLMLAYVTEAEKHIKVDIFISLMEQKAPRLSRIISFVFDLLILLVLAMLTWQGFNGGLKAMGSGEVTDSLHIPHYPFRFVLTAGFAAAFLSLLSKLIRKFADPRKGS